MTTGAIEVRRDGRDSEFVVGFRSSDMDSSSGYLPDQQIQHFSSLSITVSFFFSFSSSWSWPPAVKLSVRQYIQERHSEQ